METTKMHLFDLLSKFGKIAKTKAPARLSLKVPFTSFEIPLGFLPPPKLSWTEPSLSGMIDQLDQEDSEDEQTRKLIEKQKKTIDEQRLLIAKNEEVIKGSLKVFWNYLVYNIFT